MLVLVLHVNSYRIVVTTRTAVHKPVTSTNCQSLQYGCSEGLSCEEQSLVHILINELSSCTFVLHLSHFATLHLFSEHHMPAEPLHSQTGWMNGRMDGRIDGWMNRWIDERMDGWMSEWMDG